MLAALAKLPRDYAWPGNVRELEQAVRRIIPTRGYAPDPLPEAGDRGIWLDATAAGRLNVPALLGGYWGPRIFRGALLPAALWASRHL